MTQSDVAWLRKTVADLAVEIADDAQYELVSEGLASMGGYTRGIQPKFRRWRHALRRARKIHRRAGMLRSYRKWWNAMLGELGRKSLTRRAIAGLKYDSTAWSLALGEQ